MVDIIFTVCGELGNTVFTFGYKRIVSECVSYLIRQDIALSRFDRNFLKNKVSTELDIRFLACLNFLCGKFAKDHFSIPR